jgi:type I restriction enzyme S subunit
VNRDASIQLRHLFEIVSGSTPESGNTDYWDGDIAWVTPEDVSQVAGNVLRDTRRKLTAEGFANSGTTMASAGGIVLTKRAPIGQLALLGIDACSNQGCFLLSPREGIEPRFFYYVLANSVPLLQALGRGSTFMELSTDDLKALRVPVLAYDQQVRIANYLDASVAKVDELLQSKRGLLEILAEKRKAIIAAAVTRGLDPKVKLRDSGVPWLGEIPAHWELRRAKYLFRQSALPVATGDEIVTCFRDGQVTLRRNRREEGFTNADLEVGYQGIRQGQLVLHSMDAFAGAIGVSDSDGRCSPEYIICDPLDGDVIVPEYFGPLLRTMALAGFIQASCPAVRERAPRIRFNNFSEMYLPVPPQEEQRAIVEHIARETAKLDAVRAATERTIALLKERRSALIAAAVTGQLDLTTGEGAAA